MISPSAMTMLKNAECLRVETLVLLLDLDGRRCWVSRQNVQELVEDALRGLADALAHTLLNALCTGLV